MNIAYLDPPYSGYFHALAARLAGDGGSVVALLSSPAYKLYTNGDRCELWRAGDADAEHPLPAEFHRAAWAHTEAPAFRRAFSHAVAWFKARFAAERIEVCLVFSDARPFSQAARVAAQELGVVCIYFERGAFRNRTASLSAQGLNARFDLALAQRDEDAVRGLAPEDLPPRRPTERWLKLRFLAFMALNAWVRSRDPDLRPMQHKTYHPFNYLRIWLRERGARRLAQRDRRVRRIEVEFAGKVVLLPLQLQTDSQFVMHSPFPHNQAFIDFVVPRVTAALPGARVLVKRHPMDVRRYRLPPGAEFVEGNLARFHSRAAMLVCLNSNTGFEAALRGMPVLCFADSFYTACPQILRVERDDFGAAVAEAATRGNDADAGRRLRAAVLRFYQAPGDVWAYAEEDLDATVAIVGQHVAAARARRALGFSAAPQADRASA
jgi:capsular polysaccharide export protein